MKQTMKTITSPLHNNKNVLKNNRQSSYLKPTIKIELKISLVKMTDSNQLTRVQF